MNTKKLLVFIILIVISLASCCNATMTADKLKKIIETKFDTTSIVLFDTEYMEFNSKNKDVFLKAFNSSLNKLPNKHMFLTYDCEDLARSLSTRFIEYIAMSLKFGIKEVKGELKCSNEKAGAIPFGIITFQMPDEGEDAFHAANIFIYNEKVYVYDASINEFIGQNEIKEILLIIF